MSGIMLAPALTKAQRRALRWLFNRSGSGMFDHNGVLLAQGELAGVMRSTWNALRDAGFLVIEKKRATLTERGRVVSMTIFEAEADTVEDDET